MVLSYRTFMNEKQAAEAQPVILNRDEIGELLPHSGVLLLPDCVVLSPDKRKATGYMRVQQNPITDGHFTDKLRAGVFPGVLQVEFAYQVLAVLGASNNKELAGVASGIQNVQFNVLAKVGDVLEVEVKVTKDDVTKKGGEIQAVAMLRKIGDETKTSVMMLIAQAMKKKILVRMIRPERNPGADPKTCQALESLPPEVQDAIPPPSGASE